MYPERKKYDSCSAVFFQCNCKPVFSAKEKGRFKESKRGKLESGDECDGDTIKSHPKRYHSYCSRDHCQGPRPSIQAKDASRTHITQSVSS